MPVRQAGRGRWSGIITHADDSAGTAIAKFKAFLAQEIIAVVAMANGMAKATRK